jgi:hypothetical protein
MAVALNFDRKMFSKHGENLALRIVGSKRESKRRVEQSA